MKRSVSWGLCLLLFHSVLAADAFAIRYNPPLPTRQAEKVSEAVARLGTGAEALIALRLYDKTVLKGSIAAIESDSFLITESESGAEQRVFYGAVGRLEGVNLISGARVHVGGGFKARLARVAGVLVPVRAQTSHNLTDKEKTIIIVGLIGLLVGILLAKAL